MIKLQGDNYLQRFELPWGNHSLFVRLEAQQYRHLAMVQDRRQRNYSDFSEKKLQQATHTLSNLEGCHT